MNLTDKQKQAIVDEFNLFKDKMYAGKSKKEREALGQFFTPADLTVQILEQLDCTIEDFLDSDVIDPTSGSGNLLAAALILGVDPHRVFGNEYDYTMVAICRDRLKQINPKVRDWQIHQGNALQARCVNDFSEEYSGYGKYKDRSHYNPEYIDDLEYAQSYNHIVQNGLVPFEVNALSWREENRLAKERLEKKQQEEKRKSQKITADNDQFKVIDLFGGID